MKNEVRIRRAASDDLDALYGLEQRSFGDEAFSRRQLAYLISHAKGTCFVALHEEELAGYISLLARPYLHNLRLYSVAVAPSVRGRGIGQMLLDKAVDYARAQGLREISLEVSVNNPAAQSLYLKNGFTPVGRLTAYYHDGSDGLRMKRTVSQN